MKRILLVSGGIDSTIMMTEAARINLPCELLYVMCGESYENEELLKLQTFIEKYKIPYRLNIINISGISRYDRFVPNRNMTIASIAVTSLGADEILLAGLKDDNVVDKNDRAYAAMSNMLSEFSGKEVTVKSPYSDITKGELIRRFVSSNSEEVNALHIAMLQDTYSCYSSEEGHCGCCPACFRKFVALESNGIDSGIVLSKGIVNEYLAKLHTYPADRINRTLIALRRIFGSIDCYDLDGTLCKIDTSLPYAYKKPIPSMIEQFNRSTALKIIYTSRFESFREVTEHWLLENGIRYDVLLMDKPNYDVLYDDKSLEFK